jgi:hypothetical protein
MTRTKMMMITIALMSIGTFVYSQNNTEYWQQEVEYEMMVDMNAEKHQYQGEQKLVYHNNSPDTLHKVFYHLYFNAFQPGSQMDVRSRTIKDPDDRVGDRISKLSEVEIGYIKVDQLLQDGENVQREVVGTVLEVDLSEPILPGEKSTFNMKFNAQVPLQIRRSGRDNEEGIEFSMTQWYPKIAEYDYQGWHADPYIAREFHSVWSSFDVKIRMDKDYTIGATGYLQNPEEIGHGYTDEKVKPKGEKLTWHFKASKVLDFTWGADPDYVHDTLEMDNGTILHFFYQDKINNKENKGTPIEENWQKLQAKTKALFEYYNEHIGEYPYDQYSVIQGGDGGMEYPMCTLITGERNFESLVGVTAHEAAHSWFQHLLATNETKHEWMDEGFTTYISVLAEDKVLEQNKEFPLERAYSVYRQLATSGVEQPQTTHADRYRYNFAYGASAYSKGAVFLSQLGYIIGKENLDRTLKRYYEKWKFRHPTPNDFIRVAEKISGAELSWYLDEWTKTTNTVDYGIKDIQVDVQGRQTIITLERIGLMPMPIEVEVTLENGSKEMYYLPLRIMRWEKSGMDNVEDDWAWAFPTYELTLPVANYAVQKVEIDPSGKMADVNLDNNIYEKELAEKENTESEDSDN